MPELSDLFDPALLSDYERESLERRLERMRRYARQLAHAAQELRPPRDREPPAGSDGSEKETLFRAVRERIAAQGDAGLKQRVVRGVTEGVCRHYLWSNLASLPVQHELSVLGPWWLVRGVAHPSFRDFADTMSRELLNGIVLSVQQVREELLTADEVFIGHCACRGSGIAHDLEQQGRVFTLQPPRENRRLLDRLMDRYAQRGDLAKRTTGARLLRVLDRLARLRAKGSDGYSMDNLLRWTYPHWELLPIRKGYTTRWVRSMQNNGKAYPIDRTLALELVNIWYFSRGAVFNSMKCAGAQYTICSCPTPENEGGCVLTNWYYFGGMNHSLEPSRDYHGVRTDDEGNTLPCRYFPVRSRRPCIGCGCNHALAHPRDIQASLKESDAMLARLVPGA